MGLPTYSRIGKVPVVFRLKARCYAFAFSSILYKLLNMLLLGAIHIIRLPTEG